MEGTLFILKSKVFQRYSRVTLWLTLLCALALAMTGSGQLQSTLSAATNLAVSSSAGTITATWTPGSGATSQTIVVVNTSNDTDYCLESAAAATLATYQCAGRSEGQTYKVLVIALDDSGGYATASATHSIPSTTTQQPLEPDLAVSALTANQTSPTIGASLILETTVTNRGKQEAGSTTLRYYRSTRPVVSSADTQVGTEEVAALAANASSSHSLVVNAPSNPGAYYYRACVDQASGDLNSTNNCSGVLAVNVIAPDLVVTTPVTTTVSTNFTMEATVVNRGTGPSAATTLTYYSSTDATITTSDTSLGTDSIGILAAGGSSNQSHEATTPTSDGTYYYGACVTSVTGESDTSNNCSGALVLTIGSFDLVVSKPTVANANLSPGASFTLNATVRNQGSSTTGASATLTYYRSTDATISTTDTSVGTADTVSALAGHATSDQSTSVTAPTDPGTYYYGACISAVSGESSTTNNCSDALEITVAAPDLLVNTPVLSGSNPVVGASFTLSARVFNQGGAQSAATTLNFYRSDDATITTSDASAGSVSVNAIAASGVSTLAARLTAPSTPGDYYYGACAVAVSGESDTSNNCSAALTVTVQAPDLTVGTPTLTGSNPAVGESFTLTAAVNNRGGAQSAATVLRFYRSDDTTINDSDTEVGMKTVPARAGGVNTAYSIDLTAPATASTYYYGACVDTVAGESDTTNNCSAALTVTVTAAVTTTPDTEPDLVAFLYAPRLVYPGPGEAATVTSIVQNRGSGAAAASTLRYYHSTDSTITETDTLVGTQSLAALDASDGARQTLNVTLPTTVGTHYYGMCVDTVPGETDTDDNCATVSFEIYAPDLTVSSSRSDVNLVVDESFTLRALVVNNGFGGAVGTTVRFYRSTDGTISTSDTVVGSATVGVLRTYSRSSNHSVSLTAPSTAGTYYYGACVDAITGESSTTNNCSDALTVQVDAAAAPDLVVSARTNTSSNVTVGASFKLNATVTNQGSGSSAATTLNYYRSTDATISTSDTSLGSDSVGVVEKAGTSSQSIDLTAPAAGTYYYGACVSSVAGESATGNNCSSGAKVVVDAAPAPDLVITLTLTLSSGRGSFALAAGVKNEGSGSSDATTLRFYRSSDATISGSDHQEDTAAVGGLAAGGSSSHQATITLPTEAGTYYYGVCVDTVTDESNTTNNCSDSSKRIVE